MALSEFEKLMKRANTLLYNADKMGLTNDTLENVKHNLNLVYKNLEKNTGFKARNKNIFTKSKNLNWKDKKVLEHMAKNLLEDSTANVKSTFSKKNEPQIEKIMQEQNLKSKQEVLDFFDIMKRHKANRIQSQMLDSSQVKEMFDIAKKKNITNEELTNIINEEIKKETRKQIQANGFVESSDEIAIAIRKRLRRTKKRD